MSPGSLNTTCLDAMVLRLFKDWEHTDWFWKNPEGSNADALLKRAMVRSSSLLRRKHEEVPLVQWAEPKDPYILFIGSVVPGFKTASTAVGAAAPVLRGRKKSLCLKSIFRFLLVCPSNCKPNFIGAWSLGSDQRTRCLAKRVEPLLCRI